MADDQHLSTEYDFVAIIDGLEQVERDQWKITKELTATLQRETIRVEPFYVSDGPSLISAVERLKSLAENGSTFQIHFVIHGNDEGIGFNPTDELVLWSDLEPFLRAINAAMNGQLVLNMSSCEGLHGVKAASGEPYPFFGLVGSKLKLTIDQAKSINDTFYSMQAAGTDFNRIVEKINADHGDVLDLISAAGYDKLRRR